jgi:predicted extracellular nuclease
MKRIFYLIAALLPGSVIAQTATHVVISEIYGGGGNTGATYTNDFIELYNPGSSAVSLSGWSVQYASSGGSFTQITNLSGSIPAHGFYLVQEAAGTGGTTALPTPDATGTIAMSGTGAKVALVNTTTAIGSSCTGSSVIDLVGYGTGTSCSETSAGPATSNTASIERKANATSTATSLASGGADVLSGNGYDADNNSTDFVAQTAVNPQNSSVTEGGTTTPNAIAVAAGRNGAEPATDGYFIVSVGAAAPAGGITIGYTLAGTATKGSDYTDPKAGTVTIPATKTTDTVFIRVLNDALIEGTETVTIALGTAPTGYTLGTSTASINIIDDDLPVTKISAIQGSGATAVAGNYTAEAVVTGIYPNLSPAGFYMQEEAIDTDASAATSEGIFVVSNTSVAVGDKVRVAGNVIEGSASPSFNQAVFTSGSTVTVVSSSNPLPPATAVKLPLASMANYESLEGMLVRFADTLTVTNNYGIDRYGEIGLSAGGMVYQPTQLIDPNDNPASGTTSTGSGNVSAIRAMMLADSLRTITLDDGLSTTAKIPFINPADSTLRLGTRFVNVSGILGYAFSLYRIQPTANTAPTVLYAPRPGLPNVGNADLKIASFNVLNYFNGNGAGGGFPTSRGAHSAAEFARQRAKIITAISQLNADVVGLLEIENDGTGANSAIQDLVNGLNTAMGANTYTFINDGATKQTSSGDEIRCGIIYKPAAVTPNGNAMLDANSVHNRPPLAQAFMHTASGKKLVYIINHFKSKGCSSSSGADTDQGDGQACYNDSRRKQANALISFINTTVIPTAGTSAILSMGDYNAYYEEDPLDVLCAAGYKTLSPATSYSYQFSGQIGSLDHAVASDSLNKYVTGIEKWNINAAEPVYLDYNDSINDGGGDFVNYFARYYSPNAFRSSDHDPVLVGLRMQPIAGVGVKGTQNAAAAYVVPNPATNMAMLHTTRPLSSVTMFGADGRQVMAQQASGTQQLRIDLGNCATGLYILDLTYADGSRELLRITRAN